MRSRLFYLISALISLQFVLLPNLSFCDGKLGVVATTGMIGDLATHVGGELVEVKVLMGPGVDPHLYKASYGDLQLFQNADLIFYNGLHLEGKMSDVLEKFSEKKPCIAVASEIDEKKLRRPAEFEGQFDPHIWFNVSLWVEALNRVEKELLKQFPNEGASIGKNAASYRGELLKLHVWVKEEIAKIPKAQRVLITAHDAFGYFGDEYEIDVLGLQGISTASEFGLHDITKIADTILARKVKAVFVESSVPQKFILSLQEGVRARGGEVALGGELYSDAMGAAGTEDGTYIGMIRHNVNTIAKALK